MKEAKGKTIDVKLTLDEPSAVFYVTQDSEETYRILKSLDIFLAMHHIRDSVWEKHHRGHDFKTADDALEWCNELIGRALENYGVDLHEGAS